MAGCGEPSRVSESQPPSIDTNPIRHEAPPGEVEFRPPLKPMPRMADSIVIGIDADMTSGSARSGEAIRRGVAIAIAEINEAGGVLDHPLELIVRNHRGNPTRGIDNIEELAAIDNLVAVVGGLHTPVALEELDAIHRNEVIYLSPWAAGTPLTSNGRDPNFVFRVSVRDEYAGEFLVAAALERDKRNIGLLLERTGWGRSNQKAMTRALQSRGLEPTTVQWFHWGEPDLSSQMDSLLDSGSDAVLLVANPLEGVTAVSAMAAIPAEKRIPILSHWGITGGNFPDLAADYLPSVDLVFLQTYSFIDPTRDQRAAQVLDRYREMFANCDSARDIFAPAGTAHAYELVHLLAAAIRSAGTTDRRVVRDALESLPRHDGLIRVYEPPFTPELHDALSIEDFHMARFDESGVIVLTEGEEAVRP